MTDSGARAGEAGATSAGTAETIRIPVSGMTCAACSSRVQRTLQKQPGVADASVNLMMKTATITYDPAAVTPDRLVDAIRDTGYGAQLASPDQTAFEEQEARDRATAEEFRELRAKAIASGVVGVIAMVISMPLMS
ncbi:MAG TPA: heavy metal-associated domain-containing protein, partial [Gemmatimonadaceae bacterium]|nr:heavy metal-associated domain-containing protein [Gemmatimonadaceae bacterium]